LFLFGGLLFLSTFWKFASNNYSDFFYLSCCYYVFMELFSNYLQ